MNFEKHLRIVCVFLIIHISCLLRVEGQSVASPPRDYVYKLWDNQTGLPQNTVSDVVKDDQGYLWIATDEGLVRFDSHDFKVINQENTTGLFSSSFYDLSRSATGSIWAASRNSVLRIYKNNIKAIDFRSYIKGSWITAITEDAKGRLWVATNAGQLLYLQDSSIQVFAAWSQAGSGSIQVLKPVSDGLYLGTDDGLFKMQNGDEEIAVVEELKGMNIRTLAEDHSGSLWIGTKEHGLFQKTLTGTNQFTVKDGLSELFIYTLTVSPNGDLWIGTSSAGVQIYSKGEFIQLPEREYSHDAVRCILMDDDNSVWLGTTGYGLVQMKPADVHMISKSSGISGNIILAIYEHSNGDVWVGTAGNGVNRISGGKITHYTQRDGIGHDIILSVYGTNEAVFIGTTNGLNRFNLETGKIDKHYTVKDGLASNIVQCVFFDSGQTLWVTTRKGGIHRMTEDGKIQPVSLPVEFANAEFSGIFEDRNKNVWFGSSGAGIVRINEKDEITYYTANKGLPAGRVDDFYEDRNGALWLGTEAGLVCFMNGEFRSFDKSNGLKFNGIYRIIDDGTGFLWLSGNFGIQRISLADLEKLKRSKGKKMRIPVRLFDTNDGMANSEANGGVFPAGWKMKDGTLWFPTLEGIATVKPALINNKQKQVNIYIQSMSYGEEEKKPGTAITVPAGVYNIEIPYTSIDFKDPNTINYYYRLNGLFDEWKYAGDRRTAFLIGLSPGKYTFEVKAEQFGEWSETAKLPFEVKPFFYQTTWFAACVVLLLLAVGIFVKELHLEHRQAVRLRSMVDERNRQLMETDEVNKELDSFSYSISHDLRAPVRAINGYATMLMEDYENKLDEDGRRMLRSIMTNSVRMRQLIDDLLSFSHTGKQNLRRDLVNMNALTKKVVAELKNQEQNEKVKIILNPLISIEGDESMLRQVMTNLLSNAFKYSGKKTQPVVEAGCIKGKDNVIYYVKDNGVGFNMDYYNKMFSAFQRLHSAEDFEGTGIGLALVHRIITKHEGKVWAEGKVDEGATFYFSLPFGKNPVLISSDNC